jgi:hypothetical protein
VRCIDLRNLGRVGQSVASIHTPPRAGSRTGAATMPRANRIAKSRFIALGCKRDHGSNSGGSESNV